jgi:hypothetical protein
MGEVEKQALIFYFNDIAEHADEMGLDHLAALLALQEEFARAIEPAGIGKVDGNEIALDGSEGSLYAFGQDAKAMLKAALPVICTSPLAQGGSVMLRYGCDEGAIVESFQLADLCARRND